MWGDWWDRCLLGVAVAALTVGVWRPPWIGWVEAGALLFAIGWVVRTYLWSRRMQRELAQSTHLRMALAHQAMAELRAAQRRLNGQAHPE